MNRRNATLIIESRWILIFALGIIFSDLTLAQPNHQIDSLLNELKAANADTTKVHLLTQLGSQWASTKDKTKSINYFKDALSLAQKISFGKGEAMAYLELGLVYGGQFKYAEALKNFIPALQIYQQINDTKGVASVYNAIGISHRNLGNYPDALQNHRHALENFEKIHEKTGIENAYSNIAIIYKDQGNYPEALKYYKQSLPIVEELGDKLLKANHHANIGNVYFQMGDYPEALKNSTAALKIHRELGNKVGIAAAFHSTGNIYAVQNNYPKALENFQASLEIMVEQDNKKGMAMAYKNIGTIYKNQGNHNMALENLQNALTIFETINDKKGIAQAHHSLGSLYYTQGNYDEALKCQYAALKIAEEIGSKDQMLFGYQNIGFIFIKQGCEQQIKSVANRKFSDAVDNYKKGLSLAEENGSKHLMSKFCDALSEAYRLLDNYPLAFKYLTRHISLKDSILNDENNRKLEQLRTQYEVDKAIIAEKTKHDRLLNEQRLIAEQEFTLLAKEKNLQQLLLEKNEADLLTQQALTQIKESDLLVQKAEAAKNLEQLAVLNKEKKIQELELKKEKLAKNYFIAGLGLFLILSFFVYRNYQTRQEVKLLTIRNKIAIDLHDDVGSTLSSISMFSQMAQAQSKEHIPALETIGESSRKMLDAMADIVWSIKPENDLFEKVIMHMREFAYQLLGTKQIEFEFDADDDISKINLPMEIRKNLYLIFKEATNNMAKYSQANNAKFVLKGESDKLTMLISDDGKGFDTTKDSRGNGLVNMKKRALEIGAKLLIDSSPGIGTTIRLELAV